MDSVPDLPDFRIFQHPFCLAGIALLFHPPYYLSGKGHEGLLQPLLRQGTAIWTVRRNLWSVTKKGYTGMDEKQMVPVRISDLFSDYVSSDALEYLSGVHRSKKLETGSDAFMDL